jgi:hypothetical protein
MSETQAETQVPQASLEQQMTEMTAIAKMRHKALSKLVRAHVASYLNSLAFAPKVSGNEKADLILKFVEMLEGVLDFGVDVTGAKIPEKGPVGKKVVNIAGVLAQALDNRMLLLAQQMQEKENATNTTAPETTSNDEVRANV